MVISTHFNARSHRPIIDRDRSQQMRMSRVIVFAGCDRFLGDFVVNLGRIQQISATDTPGNGR
jgi:hypothetical protein